MLKTTCSLSPSVSSYHTLYIASPQIILHSENLIEVQVGSTMQLHCGAYGYLPLSVSWSRDGSVLTNDSFDQQITIYEEQFEEGGLIFIGSTLQICSTEIYGDTGVYSCTVENIGFPQSDTATIELIVTGELYDTPISNTVTGNCQVKVLSLQKNM